jgi:flagellar biosynthetic protein FlhB
MPAEDKHAKTEPPTPKRKKKARDDGRVPRSHDVSAWAMVLGATFILPWIFSNAEAHVLNVLGQATTVMRHPTTQGMTGLLSGGLKSVVLVIAPLGGLFVALAIVTNVAQTGRAVSVKAARPKLSRISPKAGIKRLFGAQTLVQLGKQTLKIVILGTAGYSVIHGLIRAVTGDAPIGLAPILGETVHSIIGIVRLISLLAMLIGIADYAFIKKKLTSSLKMTKAEVKEEAKAAEGSPEVKAEIKKRSYALARSRMRAAMRKADVVITNPTHFAVALQYTPGDGAAPRVVAKGSDLLAKLIKDRAVEEGVPIVEDAPLARYLFAVVEVDQQIPGEIYIAVAKLLAFIYSLPAPVRSMRVHQGLPSQLPEVLRALDSLPPTRRRQAEAVLAGVGR